MCPAVPAPRLMSSAPELHVRSDWSRNALTADITGSYIAYGNDASRRRSTALISTPKSTAASTSRARRRSSREPLHCLHRQSRQSEHCGRSRQAADRHHGRRHARRGAAIQPARCFAQRQLRPLHVPEFRSDRRRERRATPTATSTNMPASCASATSSIPAFKPFVEVSEDTRVHDLQFDINGCSATPSAPARKVGGDVRSLRLAHRRDGGRISRAHLQGPDAAGHQRHDRRRRADLAGDRADHSQAHCGFSGGRVDPAGRFRRFQPRLQPSGRSRAAALAHRHACRSATAETNITA